MYASIQRRPVSMSYLLGWYGRILGVFLFAAWVGFVIAELLVDKVTLPGITLLQACALVVVFAGYAIGWRRQLAGSLLTLFGTAAFFVVHVITLEVLPSLAITWFAAPGVLYLLAWLTGYRFGRTKTSSRMRWDQRHSEELFFSRLRKRAARRATTDRAELSAGRVLTARQCR